MSYATAVSAHLRSVAHKLREIDQLGDQVSHHRLDKFAVLAEKIEAIANELYGERLGKASALVQQLLGKLNDPAAILAAIPRGQVARMLGSHKSERKSEKARLNGRNYGGRPRKDGRPQNRRHRPPAPGQ
jgi:hypothetical protein